jgi:hypothetical protein
MNPRGFCCEKNFSTAAEKNLLDLLCNFLIRFSQLRMVIEKTKNMARTS